MNERRKNIFSLLALVLVFIVLVGFVIPTYSQVKSNPVDKTKLFKYTIDSDPEQTKLLAEEQYKVFPPLRPERFRRRMKMLWGLDINDYPNDCVINLGGDRSFGFYLFNTTERIIYLKTYQDDPVIGDYIPKSFPPEKYALFYRYIMMDDRNALQEYYQKYNLTETYENPFPIDFIKDESYYAIFDARKFLLRYKDSQKKELLTSSISNRQFDAVLLYTKQEQTKGRKLYFSRYDEPRDLDLIGNDIHLQPDPFYPSYKDSSPIIRFISYFDEKNSPWYPTLTAESITAAWLSFQLALDVDSINIKIVRDLYRDYKDFETTQNAINKLKKGLQNNDYYGHSILREFCENPMREMPTLEKIGTNFKAKVNKSNSLLLLEPFADSYDIDTIQPNEIFKAYEMGHDDYYFIEIEKPVESPVAGKDGYAMILDRKETVYGYLPKLMVKKYTSQEVLSESRYTDKTKSKQGVIEDKDGFVNIRKEANSESEVVGKIPDKEKFQYWETSDNWYIVETNSGLRGYVFKDRIREKYDTGGWTIDE